MSREKSSFGGRKKGPSARRGKPGRHMARHALPAWVVGSRIRNGFPPLHHVTDEEPQQQNAADHRRRGADIDQRGGIDRPAQQDAVTKQAHRKQGDAQHVQAKIEGKVHITKLLSFFFGAWIIHVHFVPMFEKRNGCHE